MSRADWADFVPSDDEKSDQEISDAWEEWRRAIDYEAQKHNEYLRVLSLQYLEGNDIAISARKEWANQQTKVNVELRLWNHAVAQEKRCRSKVDQLRDEAIRKMSEAKRASELA